MQQLPLMPFPTVVSLETTSACNARCVMCVARDKVKRDPVIMPTKEFEHIVDQCVGKGVVLFSLTHFGEPLLDPHIVDRVAYIRTTIKPWVRIAIWSNATLLTPELAGSLIDAGLTNMHLSMDSTRKQTYEAMRRGLRFEAALDGIHNFIQANEARDHPCQVTVHATATRLNYPEMPFLVAHWKHTAGIDGADWLPAETGRDIDPSMAKDASVRDPCASPFNNFTVQSDGVIVLCCKDHDALMPLGNAFEQSIEEVWASERYGEIRKLHNSGRKDEVPLCAACGAYR